MADLRVVPDLPQGTEQLVEDLARIATERMAEVYIAGFKLGVGETLRILSDSGKLDAQLQQAIDDLLAHWQTEEDNDGDST